MRSLKIIVGFVIILSAISLCSCVPEEIILHGDIRGYVTDAETSEPLKEVTVELNQSNIITDTTSTGSDGSYLLNNISAGNYEIQASKSTYKTATKDVILASAKTTEINFELVRTASIEFSNTYLDYGAEATLKSFTISNKGSGTLRYSLIESQDWITVDPRDGEVTTETDTITVSIDRTLLFEETQKERITITSIVGEDDQQDQIDVFVNGVLQEEYYYRIVRIGTQTWMAENLNRGAQIHWIENEKQMDDEWVEKFCYDNDINNCDIYGGLYSWWEAMEYSPPDSGMVGTTQGICPDGWHIPTNNEWETLINYLGGSSLAGGPLKDTGNIEEGTGLWDAPNKGATNETGFTALPAGLLYWAEGATIRGYAEIGFSGSYWTASAWLTGPNASSTRMGISSATTIGYLKSSNPVRCIKDP